MVFRSFLTCLLLFGVSALGQPPSPCAKDNLFGYCDRNGVVRIPHIFQRALSFRGPLAAVVPQDGYWWFMNDKGHLKFNSRAWADQQPPQMYKGLYIIRYFDPIFADVTEHYNRYGLPVMVEDTSRQQADTIIYSIFAAEKATALARTKLGTPYGSNQMDCSGFIRFVFAPFGIVLPFFAREIAERGREIQMNELREGDLVFYGGNPGFEKNVNHVGMVISVNKEGYEFIHSSTSKGVIISKSSEPYYKKRFLFVRRIFG